MKYFAAFFCSISLLMVGCSGMNQAECINANWELVGLEDGSRGRNLSYANEHQSDCSKYGSQVEMDAYRRGHAEGVLTFCQPENGFSQGRIGRSYNGICPRDMESLFLSEYEIGREFYDVEKQISAAESLIRDDLDRIDYLNRQIDNHAEQAVRLDISRSERDRIQADMRNMQFEILDLERAIAESQFYLESREEQLRELEFHYDR